MIKAIFFDVTNVLVSDGFHPGIAAYERAHDIPAGALYASCHDRSHWTEFSLGNISEEQYFEGVRNDCGALDVSELRESIIQHSVRNEELTEYVRTLKDRYILGVISNSPREWFDRFWDAHALGDTFSVKAVSGHLHVRKPDVRIFEHALREAGVTCSEALYVDDRGDRASGAAEVGMEVFLYRSVGSLKERLARG